MVKYTPAGLDRTFQALADPTRRAIIERLTRGEASVGELAEPFDMSWPAVTKHLRVLVRAGLVVQRRQGNSRRCSLVGTPLKEANAWIERHEAYWQTQLDALADYFQAADTPRESVPPKRKRVSKR